MRFSLGLQPKQFSGEIHGQPVLPRRRSFAPAFAARSSRGPGAAAYSPLWVGAKRGFFEQQGLDVHLILLRGVPMTMQALVAGSLQVGSGGPEPDIEAAERGLDFAIAGGIINGMAQVLIAGKNYKTIEDLRGGTIGASSLTSAR